MVRLATTRIQARESLSLVPQLDNRVEHRKRHLPLRLAHACFQPR